MSAQMCTSLWWADGAADSDHGVSVSTPPHRCTFVDTGIGTGLEIRHEECVCACGAAAKRPDPQRQEDLGGIGLTTVRVDEHGTGKVMVGLTDVSKFVSGGTVEFKAGHATTVTLGFPLAVMALSGGRGQVAVPLGQDATAPAHFPPGSLLEVNGNCKAVLDGDRLPDNACALTNPTAATEQEAFRIADRVAAEEPTAGAGRVTRRLLTALLEAGLIAQQINGLAAVLQHQFGFDLDGRTLANVRSSVSDHHEFFNADKIRFRIEGDLVPVAHEEPR
jgi:hypothetical protein